MSAGYAVDLACAATADGSSLGGKGANLARLVASGFPVPAGFCLTTHAYDAFLDGGVRAVLLDAAAVPADDMAALEAVSELVKREFLAHGLPAAIDADLLAAYDRLGGVPVAVRSSATAEDQPGLSFAGLHDTFLNVVGPEALRQAVLACWASLWTARAIGYWRRNGVDHVGVSMAVVVQQLVAGQTSGVAFTANPVTGCRDEVVVDAVWGLGEALVSGRVEPDHFVVRSGQVVSQRLGSKSVVVEAVCDGGTRTIAAPDVAARATLDDVTLLALVQLARRIQDLDGIPQDIEWVLADGTLWVVQSRPITTLYPLPAGARPGEVFYSFAYWQGMLDPFTQLGCDAFAAAVENVRHSLGVHNGQPQRALLEAGGRLWVNITGLLQTALGRALVFTFLRSVDPVSADILRNILGQPRDTPRRMTVRQKVTVLRAALPVVATVMANLANPAAGRARFTRQAAAALKRLGRHLEGRPGLAAPLTALGELTGGLPPHVLVGQVACGQAPLQILTRLAADVPDGPELVDRLSRGLPQNVTTQMDLELSRLAEQVRADPVASARLTTATVAELVADFRAVTLPAVAQDGLARFLHRHGVRGFGEIDLGRARWGEDPAGVIEAVRSHLAGVPDRSPTLVFERAADEGDLARNGLVAAFRATPGRGHLARLAGFLAGRYRENGGRRESPKRHLVEVLAEFRAAFLAGAAPHVAAGRLARADDVFWLHADEVQALERGEARDWAALVACRRDEHQRERRRDRVPRVLLADGTTYTDAEGTVGSDWLTGVGVSAGMVEGPVRVVRDPRTADLQPGEILVCVATDPAWTPLFLVSAGLVTEVGGMMTHGSVVAREYGIPAVVGVPEATSRLVTGQRVRIDGSTGTITRVGQEPIELACPGR